MARDYSQPIQATSPSQQIIDIRRNGSNFDSLLDQIREGLNVPAGSEKQLPTLLLYNKQGLQLFERITYLDEYYLTNEEISVLQQNAHSIAERIAPRPDSIIVELGSGNLRKVRLLLDALEKRGIPVTYYALDLSQEELERTLAEIPPGTFKHVTCYGLLGTYDDGLAWLKQPKNIRKPKIILHLGSSIGNFNRQEAVGFLAQYKAVLGEKDTFLLGVDGCTDPEKVYHAYNDRFGLTHEFVLNGLAHANELIGYNAFNLADWQVIGEYDVAAGRHHAFVSPTRDVVVEGVAIPAGERIRIEESYKFDRQQMAALLRAAGYSEGAKWTNDHGYYGLHLLHRPRVHFPQKPEEYAAGPIPSLEEYQALWTAWDTVTRDMIPDEELLNKPIKLRNACIFYLGHIPAFMDIHLTRATAGKPTDPAFYHQMFERGIDPDVDDPSKCHAHSEIPDEWPPLIEMLEYQQRVRSRITDLYKSGQAETSKSVGRALWLGLEHEIMHLETLLYMLVQSDKTLPPPGTVKPDFAALAKQAKQEEVPNEWFDIPATELTIGIDDPDDNSGPAHFFGWDNERPARHGVKVEAFQIQARPITNGEYAAFLEKTGRSLLPASWTETSHSNGHSNGDTNGHAESNGTNGHTNGSSAAPPSKQFVSGKAVRTVYGPIPLSLALSWPVSASYDELSACAAYLGGRIPSMHEARAVYAHVAAKSALRAETIPAVNSHLLADGVEETPPSRGAGKGAGAGPTPDPKELFVDLEGTNTGFRHWHPMPVTHLGGTLGGQAAMGGLWEWTSTAFHAHEGFEPMDLYPAYSADFFDEKHNVVLGGSWATAPRVAGRKSFVNWYQRNYPYVWAGARVCRDV